MKTSLPGLTVGTRFHFVYKSENTDIIRTVRAIKEMITQGTGKGMLTGYVDTEAAKGPKGPKGGPKGIPSFLRFLNRGRQEESVYRYGPVRILLAQDQSRFVQNRYKIVLTNGVVGLVFVLSCSVFS